MYTTEAKINAMITTTQDVEAMIKAVSKSIDKYVGYKLGFDNATDTAKDYLFSGSGTRDLFLGDYFLESTSIEADEVVITPTKMPLNADYFNWLKQSTPFKAGLANIKILGAKKGRYVVDWTTTANHTLPEDITEACNKIVIAEIKKADGQVASSGIKSSETMGAYSVSFDTSDKNLDASFVTATKIIDNYKAINIA